MTLKKAAVFLVLSVLLLTFLPVSAVQAQITPAAPLTSETVPEGNYRLVLTDPQGRTAALHASGGASYGSAADAVPVQEGDASQVIGIRKSFTYAQDATYNLYAQRAGYYLAAGGTDVAGTSLILVRNAEVSIRWKWHIRKSGDAYCISYFENDGFKIASDVQNFTGGTDAVSIRNLTDDDSCCRFMLYPLRIDPAYSVRTGGTSAGPPPENGLGLLEASDLNLPQNAPVSPDTYVTTEGEFMKKEIVTAETTSLYTTHWRASKQTEDAAAAGGDWKTNLLPFYRFTMDRDVTGQRITVDYPVCGIYRGRPCGARAVFSDMHFSDECVAAYDRTSGKYRRILKVATRLTGGFSRSGISDMKVTLTFYDAATKETIVPQRSYLTFDSLSGSDDFSTESDRTGEIFDYIWDMQNDQRNGFHEAADRFGEFVGYADGRQDPQGYVWGSPSSSAAAPAASDAGTNILAANLEIRSPYSLDDSAGILPVFIAQRKNEAYTAAAFEAPWTDTLKAEDFRRNSVSLALDEAGATSFLVGGFSSAEQWTALSAEPDYINLSAPLQRLAGAQNSLAGGTFEASFLTADGTSCVINRGGGFTVSVTQKMPVFGTDMQKVLSSLRFTETFPAELVCTSLSVADADGADITSVAGNAQLSEGSASFVFLPAYLADASHYDGRNLTFTLRFSAAAGAVPGTDYALGAVTWRNGNDASCACKGADVLAKCREGSLMVRTIWNDADNASGARPPSLDIQILRDGNAYDAASVSGTGNVWEYSPSGLPFMDAAGRLFVWTAEEEHAPERYSGSFSAEGNTFAITNWRESQAAAQAGKESLFLGETTVRTIAASVPGYVGLTGSELTVEDALPPSLDFEGGVTLRLAAGRILPAGQAEIGADILTLAEGTDYNVTLPGAAPCVLSVLLTDEGRRKAQEHSGALLLLGYSVSLNEKAKAGENAEGTASVIFRNGAENAAPENEPGIGGDPARRQVRCLLPAPMRTGGVTVSNTASAQGHSAEGTEYTVMTKNDGILHPVRGGNGAWTSFGNEGYAAAGEDLKLVISGDGTASFTGLPDGTWYLVETRAAKGHTLLAEPVSFIISKEAPVASVLARDSVFIIYDSPSTGGAGTAGWTAAGAALIGLAGGGVLAMRLRKKKKEAA